MPLDQTMAALKTAQDRRMELAKLKRQVLAGQLPLAPLIVDPPDCLMNQTVIDAMMFSRAMTANAKRTTRAKLGRMAVADGINLLVILGDAGERTRLWAAERVPNVTRWSVRPR